MIYTVKVFAHVYFQKIALCAVLFIEFTHKKGQAIYGEMRSFSCPAGGAVINQPVFKIRFQHVIRKTVLNHSVSEYERLYFSDLWIIDREMVITAYLIGFVFKLIIKRPQILRKVQFKGYDFMLCMLCSCRTPIRMIEISKVVYFFILRHTDCVPFSPPGCCAF